MNITQLFSWSYLVDPRPEGDFLVGYGLLAFFLLVLFSRTLWKSFGPNNKYFLKTLKKKFLLSQLFGGLGLFLVLSRFGEVPYFSVRIALLLALIAALFYWGRSIVLILTQYKKRIKSVEREKTKQSKS